MMIDIYDTYGINDNLPAAAERVASALGVELRLHSSDYLGGTYYRTPFPDDTVEVIGNGAVDDPDDLPYQEYEMYSVIVEVSESPKCDEYREKLLRAGFIHLSREAIDSD